MDGHQSTTVGYGITSDPIRECAYDARFAAIEFALKEPWRAIEVEQAGCSIENCQEYTLPKTKLKASGEKGITSDPIRECSGDLFERQAWDALRTGCRQAGAMAAASCSANAWARCSCSCHQPASRRMCSAAAPGWTSPASHSFATWALAWRPRSSPATSKLR